MKFIPKLLSNASRLILCIGFSMFGYVLSGNTQSIQTPDSISNTVTLMNEILNSKTSKEAKKTYPSTLVQFLENFHTPKSKIKPEQLHYLTYAYLGFLQALDGNYAEALREYEYGYPYLKDARPYDKYLGHFYLLKGKALLETGDKERGLQSLKDAEEVFLLKKHSYFLSQVYHTEFDYYNKKGFSEKAIQSINKSIKQSKNNGKTKVASLIKRGQLYSQLDRFSTADKDFAEAKKLVNRKNIKQTGELNAARGQHYLRQEKPEKALALYDEALEQLCPGIRTEKFDAFKNCTNPIAFLSTLQLRGDILSQSHSKNPEKNILKNIYNNNITGIRYLQYLKKSDSKSLTTEQYTKNLDVFLEEGIEGCFLLDSLHRESDLFVQNAINLANLRKHPDANKTIQLAELQELATKEQRTFLSFFYGQDHLFAFLTDKNGHRFHRITKPTDFDYSVFELIELHHLPLQSISQIGRFKDLSLHVYTSLFEHLVISDNKIVIVSDRLLSHLPFESLLVSADKSPDGYPFNYLLFNNQITYAYSLNQAQQDLNAPPLKTRSVFTFAPIDFKKHGLIPLEGTMDHIRFLEEKFECKKWLEEEATIENFQQAWSDIHNMVAFTTHAKAGERPSIFFYNEDLLISELPEMKANLAILNNCNTLVKTDKINDTEPLAISNTFSEKGIPTTVMPLWSTLHQKSVYVLELFYLHLASGMPKDEAMTKAKIRYLKNCGNDAIASAPHFWAGTMLTGNTQALYQTSYFLPLIIIGLLILLLFVWKRSQAEMD